MGIATGRVKNGFDIARLGAYRGMKGLFDDKKCAIYMI